MHSFADAPVRLQLPGPAHSCHVLHRTLHRSGTQQTRAAVVLNDGRIGVTDLTAGSTAGPLTVLPAPASSPSPRRTLASSHGDTLVVLTQSAPGSDALLRVLRTSSTAQPDFPGLTQVKSLTVPCPGGTAHNATPLGLTLSFTYVLVHWSNAHATAIHGLPGGATTPLRAVTLPLAEAVSANGAGCSTSAPAQPTTPGPAGTPAAGGKKRKNAGAAATPGPAGAAAAGSGGGGPRVLCAAVDDGQFLVLDLDSGAARSQVCYSLHDAQFGCPLASGVVEVDAPLLSLQQAQCSVVHADAEATVVRLGGAVHVLHVRTQPVSLLSLVARLSVSASASAAAAAGGAPGSGSASVPAAARGAPAVGGRAVAAALAALPQPVQLDPGLLRAPAPPAPLPANTHAGTIAITAALAAAAADAGEVVVLQPVPATAFSRPADICSSLVEQLSAVQPPAVPSQQLLDSAVSYIAGRRQHGMGIPPQLLSLTAQGLVAAKLWAQLATLLTHITPGGLVDCSSVLVAAATAQQYALLPRLATCLDEVDPNALVNTLAILLAPTTRSNLPERQKHHAALRRTAESLVAAAESAAAAAEGPAPQGRGRGRAAAADPAAALALAQCGAAAVDGWSYREATLHALLAMPVDAPAVQVALKGLPAAAADALLGYLAKWVAKYAGGALGELAAGAVLPQELLFPYYHQVGAGVDVGGPGVGLQGVRGAPQACARMRLGKLSQAVRGREGHVPGRLY